MVTVPKYITIIAIIAVVIVGAVSIHAYSYYENLYYIENIEVDPYCKFCPLDDKEFLENFEIDYTEKFD